MSDYKEQNIPLFTGVDYTKHLPADSRNVKINLNGSIEVIGGYTSKCIESGIPTRIPSMYIFNRRTLGEEIFFAFDTFIKRLASNFASSTEIATGLTSDKIVGSLDYNDKFYFGNGVDECKKISFDGSNNPTVKKWGIAAPTDSLSLSQTTGGSLLTNYTYKYKITYWNNNDGVESSACIEVSILLTGSNTKVTFDVLDPTDEQITHVRIYRTKANGVLFYRDQQVVVTGSTLNIVSTVADASITVAYSTDGLVPPPKSNIMVLYNNRAFLVDADNPNAVSYSNNAQTGGGYIEYFNAGDVLRFKFAVKAIVIVPNGLLFCGDYDTFLMSGDSPTQFVSMQLSTFEGCSNMQSVDYYGKIPFWCSPIGIYTWSGSGIVDISDKIKKSDNSDLTDTFLNADKTNACGLIDPINGYYRLTCKAYGSSNNDITFVYDIKRKLWTREDTQPFISGVFIKASNTILMGGAATSIIYQLNSGTKFGSTLINSYYETGELLLGTKNYKYLGDLRLFLKTNNNITLTIKTEKDTTGIEYTIKPSEFDYTLHRVIKGLGSNNTKGMLISFRFTNINDSVNNLDGKFYIYNSDITIKEEPIP